MRRRHPVRRTAVAVCAVLSLTACAHKVAGEPVSVYADPFRVGGLEAVTGPSGLRPDAPDPSREVDDGDGGEVDTLAAQSVSDIEEFWETAYEPVFGGEFHPVDELVSWDARKRGGSFCDLRTYRLANAAYCKTDNIIGWDRGVLLPSLREAYGDMAITMVLAHEYGHAVSFAARLIGGKTPTLVAEQQADCFAGVYLRWVAEGESSRFTLNTSDGLNNLLAGMLALRDPVSHEDDSSDDDEHGSAFERISAFQYGFSDGASSCAAIDTNEVEQRRGDLPVALQQDQTGEWPVSEESVQANVNALTSLFDPADPPQLSFDSDEASSCDNARPSDPVSYCPATNTITVDLPALEKLGAASDDEDVAMPTGDNTAYSVLVSRYMLSVQNQYGGLVLDNAEAGLRTACLTGVATTLLSQGVSTPDGDTVTLSAGDLDEAVAGLLTNGLVASDVNGETVPAGFSRIDAFRAGVLGDTELCIKRFA